MPAAAGDGGYRGGVESRCQHLLSNSNDDGIRGSVVAAAGKQQSPSTSENSDGTFIYDRSLHERSAACALLPALTAATGVRGLAGDSLGTATVYE